MAISLFRAIGSLARNIVVANALGSMALFCVILMGGFVLVKDNIHPWTCVLLLPVAKPALSQRPACKTTHQCWPALCYTSARHKTPAPPNLTLEYNRGHLPQAEVVILCQIRCLPPWTPSA